MPEITGGMSLNRQMQNSHTPCSCKRRIGWQLSIDINRFDTASVDSYQGKIIGTEVNVPKGLNRSPMPAIPAGSGLVNCTYPRFPIVTTKFAM